MKRKNLSESKYQNEDQIAAPAPKPKNKLEMKPLKLYSLIRIGFNINFEKLLAVSDCNKINVYTAREFVLVDMLVGHKSPIRCLDVSSFTKDIISYSKDKIILHRIHQMKDNPRFY